MELFLIIAGIIVFWNLIITFFLWRTISHYQHLTAGVGKLSLDKILTSFIKERRLTVDEVGNVKKQIEKLAVLEQRCFQKIGLVKFNPFSDLGGDQSFSLAILDGSNRGLVITSLHGRQTTRVYTKLIDRKTEPKLSEEEKLAVKKAEGK